MVLAAWVEDVEEVLRIGVGIDYSRASWAVTTLEGQHTHLQSSIDAFYGQPHALDVEVLELHTASPMYAPFIPHACGGALLEYRVGDWRRYEKVVESAGHTIRLDSLLMQVFPSRLEAKLTLSKGHLSIKESEYTFPGRMALPRLLPQLLL